ncbi:PIN domain-containing protein [Clostridium pasteurianum]|uniref:PIN domain-containing protein n=1 Tax=Clostridium pasteurianum TaxID=1501 RepID=UPI0022609FD4|nr:PIN domain-containing protein [Clostridium pasteurianum]UZW13177.1 PIN domain-containing protein [Clostridium pasteurianum]
MKYLMIDTNIYIDMVVSRNGSHKPESYNQLMKLLDYGEVKVIIPKIVITEVFRHLDNEIDKIGQSVNEIKSKSNSLYWINHIDELEKFNDNLKPIKQGINDLVDEFDKNKENYKLEYEELFNKLFHHTNSIILPENENIIFKATQREIHKLRPFHYGGKDKDKDSTADSIIIESLINIKDLMAFNACDEIYFISRNPVDFSDDNDRNLFHKDIKYSLKAQGLEEKVHYRLMFTQTLLRDFNSEIEHVGLLEQLESDLELQRQADIDENYAMQEDMERESAGLSSLSYDYLEEISEHDKILDLLSLLEEMKNDIAKISDEYYDLYESLNDQLNIKKLPKLKSIIESNQLLKTIITDYTDEDDIRDSINAVINWLLDNENSLDLEDKFQNKDYFNLNDTLAIFCDISGNEYRLETKGYLTPSNDYEDTIYIQLYKENTLIVENRISVYYGYINFDEDGNVGDASEEHIDVYIDNIISKLIDIKDSIINTINCKKNKVLDIIKIIK